MSSPLLEKDLDPTPLVTALTEKTKAGKVKWEPTAAENTFIASVGGGTTLRLDLTTDQEDVDEYGQLATVTVPQLRLLGEKGTVLWEISTGKVKGGLWPLFELAQRVANKLDERLASLMGALDQL